MAAKTLKDMGLTKSARAPGGIPVLGDAGAPIVK